MVLHVTKTAILPGGRAARSNRCRTVFSAATRPRPQGGRCSAEAAVAWSSTPSKKSPERLQPAPRPGAPGARRRCGSRDHGAQVAVGAVGQSGVDSASRRHRVVARAGCPRSASATAGRMPSWKSRWPRSSCRCGRTAAEAAWWARLQAKSPPKVFVLVFFFFFLTSPFFFFLPRRPPRDHPVGQVVAAAV